MATIRQHAGADAMAGANGMTGAAIPAAKKYSSMVANALAVSGGEVLQAYDAFADRAAPKPLTGCISSISAYAPVDHAYTDALKNYAEVYEAFQSYLSPLDALPEHDYDQAIAMSMLEVQRPESEDDMLGFVVPKDIPVSEEEIEHCGYMAWLRH